MGEDPWRVHMVGTPGATIRIDPSTTKETVAESIGVDLSGRVFVVLQHPVTTEAGDAPRQMRETMEAVCSFSQPTVVIYPNSDAGGRSMIEVIKQYEGLPFVSAFKSLPRPVYTSLLSVSDVLIGNSSSALSNAPNFGLPAVNVGTRQQGRERGGNLIDVDHDQAKIREAINYALDHQDDPDFRAKCRESPYHDTDAAEQIVEVLSTVELGASLIQKRFYDGESRPIGSSAGAETI
jgi:UDP-hydrolysing UDP-N-acetyl-D-glucosamine 2-epimerase